MKSVIANTARLLFLCALLLSDNIFTTAVRAMDVGIAIRDISPPLPIRTAGYAARKNPATKQDTPLLLQALALKNSSGGRFVFVALDNCEVSRAFMAPALKEAQEKLKLAPGELMVVSSHSHSTPVLEDTLVPMYQMSPAEKEIMRSYSRHVRAKIIEVVGAALEDCQPASLEHGVGRATFAVNRRIHNGANVNFGENPDAPVDWDVPVLKVKAADGSLRGIVFGYACHATSISVSNDFYTVTGEYMAYARQHLESVYPSAKAIFLTGMGADSNPSPRGRMLDSKAHGLELAGAVAGVLKHPMRPVNGEFRLAYDEVELPFVDMPTPEQLDKDAQNPDIYIRERANLFKSLLAEGKPLPGIIKLPVSVVRIGNDLTFISMAGEVVVDYSRQFKRIFANDHPWTIGYAYEVPCYIPSARILKEGGYEAETSLIYYGLYGPFQPTVEQLIVNRVKQMVAGLRQ